MIYNFVYAKCIIIYNVIRNTYEKIRVKEPNTKKKIIKNYERT